MALDKFHTLTHFKACAVEIVLIPECFDEVS
jgi:hypothetical protein